MKDKKLVIADGHHRYETALNYRNERRKEAGSVSESAPYERVMMTFVNMTGHGLLILPTHRVVSGLIRFDPQQFLSNVAKFFKVEDAGNFSDLAKAIDKLEAAGKSGIALLAGIQDSFYLLTAKPAAAKAILEQVPELQRQLDVVHLHKVLLEHVMGMSEESIRNQEHVSYYRDPEEAIDLVRKGADVAFILNPVRIEQLRDISFAGGVLPQKSTDFYPKLLSGLTVYSAE